MEGHKLNHSDQVLITGKVSESLQVLEETTSLSPSKDKAMWELEEQCLPR